MILRSHVPCNGCTACCQNDLLVLHPEHGDNLEAYQTQECANPITGKPAVALAHKPEGGCIYLGDGGCTIHDRAPAICREFDCREFYRKLRNDMTRTERRRLIKANMVSAEILKAGRDRLPDART